VSSSNSRGLCNAGAKNGLQQVRVQLQSVDLSVKDLEVMCTASRMAATNQTQHREAKPRSRVNVRTLHDSSA
jgi:hypothetical protein